MILAEIDLPTILFGFITAFTTAVAYLYKDMRKDMAEDKKKCATDIARLYNLLEDLKDGPCLKKNCPLYKKD